VTGEVKLAIGIMLAVGAALGVTYAVAMNQIPEDVDRALRKPRSIPPGNPVTPQGATIPFARSTAIIPKGNAVAVSIAQSDLQAAATAAGLTADTTGLVALLSTPAAATLLGTSAFILYDPGTPLPPSWPKDDPSPATEYHVAFVAGVALDPTQFPIPAIVWDAQIPNS
jgi:hypothetical protein